MTKAYETIANLEDLHALYGTPKAPSMRKVADRITPDYRKWIEASPICALATVGPEGVDASPRGDQDQVVFELDEKTLAMPDRRGNDRIDSLRNIVKDGRVALMLMVPKSNTVIRVNGRAVVTADTALLERFSVKGAAPRSVILITIEEMYFQCARAMMRAEVWIPESWGEVAHLPTPGQILASMTDNEVGGEAYDKAWPERAKSSMW